jgi:hypothetical protein
MEARMVYKVQIEGKTQYMRLEDGVFRNNYTGQYFAEPTKKEARKMVWAITREYFAELKDLFMFWTK